MDENIIKDNEQPEQEVAENNENVEEKDETQPATYTEEDVQKRIQSETDKVRTEYSKKVKCLEERIAELLPKEMTPAELELKNRLDELEARQKEVAAKEELLAMQSQLSDANLPKSLVTYLKGNSDVGELAKMIDTIVTERNKGLGYQPTPHVNADGMTHEKWAKLSYSQKVELYNTNPDLYSQFMKPKT